MRRSLFFSIMLFAILLISSIIDYLGLAIPFLNILPSLINSSTGFLSVLCLVAIFCTFIKHNGDKSNAIVPILFFFLDLAIVNKLYLNTTWTAIVKWVQEMFRSITGWNWPNIILTIFCLAITIGMLIWGVAIWKNGTASKKNHTKVTNSVRGVLSKSDQETVRSTTIDNSIPTLTQNEDASTDMPSLAYGLICILLIIPAVSFIQFIFYRVFPWDIKMPDVLDNILDIMVYLDTICIGLVVALLLWIAKKKTTPGSGPRNFRRPAVLALIGEILIFFLFFFQADLIDEDFLNSFLNVITDNTLVSIVVIPIVIFVILDVGISLFINIFFEDILKDSKIWREEAHTKVNEIQRRIVMFVLNVFLGILNLFLFIPDFFNVIGDVLLSEQNIFPSYSKGGNEHPSPSSEPSDPVENSEISCQNKSY